NGGSARPQASGGSPAGFGSSASATATSTAMLGGTANALAGAFTGDLLRAGGPANANSFAMTINGNTASARSDAFSGTAGRPRQPHRPISEISNRFNLRPQALLIMRMAKQSHRPIVSFVFRSFQGGAFRALAGQALAL